MRKYENFFILIFILTVCILYSQDLIQKKGKTYLVIVALDNYKNRLPIQGHVKDAIDLKWNIYSKYDIDEIVELYNIDATYCKY